LRIRELEYKFSGGRRKVKDMGVQPKLLMWFQMKMIATLRKNIFLIQLVEPIQKYKTKTIFHIPLKKEMLNIPALKNRLNIFFYFIIKNKLVLI